MIAAKMPYAENIITVRSIKIVPNTIIWTVTDPETGFTNWGIKAIKNNATFGLSALTSKPCQKLDVWPVSLLLDSNVNVCRCVKAFQARKIRYNPPTHFMIINPVSVAKSMRDRPKPAARMCTAIPVLVPSAETIPALRPPAILRDMTNSIPGPGAMTTNRAAKKNK
jgi:hypothetical protein